MDLGISDKRAVITGASAGLGFAAALALAEEGVNIAINSRSLDNLEKAAKQIKTKTGIEPVVIAGDLGQPGIAEQIAKEATKKLGGIDILVSNAGGPPAGPFLQHDKETWRASAEQTLHAAIDLTRAVIPGMAANRWGRVIYITSIAVKQPVDGLIISNTLRAGLTGFAKTIANECGKSGITVNMVCPGYTNTERLKYLAQTLAEKSSVTVDDIYQGWADGSPVGRIGQPEELAAMIAFLASEKAAFITGVSVPVDGGSYKGLL
jgi:3-oxoacyl-[acyl-carrier protein] reductase